MFKSSKLDIAVPEIAVAIAKAGNSSTKQEKTVKQAMVTLAATIVVLTIASSGAEAVKFNPSPIVKPQVFNTANFDRRCKRDHNKCYRFIPSLCRRLLAKGMGGGSIGNCTSRKALRCDIRLDRCQAKADKRK